MTKQMLNSEKKSVVVIVGPTAVGKTEVCIRLAKIFDTEIVSADSRQFYREMSIGTAKPTESEQNGIKHHFVDSHSVKEEYNAVSYEKDALQVVETILQIKPLVIVTGGSGLYIKTFCEGMDPIPDVDIHIRQQFTRQLEREGLAPLIEKLDTLDPDYAGQVDRFNPQRIIRALEVCLGTGKPYSSFRQKQKSVRPFGIIKIGLDRDRSELYERIDKRMEGMLAQGLVEEARALLPFREHNALQTVGYSEVFDYLDGKYDKEEMIRLLKRNSRRYAKRQLTWFRRDEEIKWFHPDEFDKIVEYIKNRAR